MGFLILGWLSFIFVVTCTKNVTTLLEGKADFSFVPDPQWSGLFKVYPISDISIVEFFGHFMMFFILTTLLVALLKKITIACLLAFMYGVIIEVLQLYFGRGAELYDIIANLVGIVAVGLLIRVAKYSTKGDSVSTVKQKTS
ncbi:VanZ family protein [Virgibacillus byunsanensis]|uniref:VanZ family protein n=1 Tax=Virgibacillus byunsanensis TaxID=570945 RepID=A0ABW3LGH8_9BACI